MWFYGKKINEHKKIFKNRFKLERKFESFGHPFTIILLVWFPFCFAPEFISDFFFFVFLFIDLPSPENIPYPYHHHCDVMLYTQVYNVNVTFHQFSIGNPFGMNFHLKRFRFDSIVLLSNITLLYKWYLHIECMPLIYGYGIGIE